MELSGCGDVCRRTANFYAALRCYEVLGLASVERIPRLSGCKPSYTEICYTILPHPLPSSPYRQHTKNTRFTKPLFSQYYGKTKETCRNVCIWSSGECNGWPVSRHEPLDTTPSTFREIGQQEDLLANLMLHVSTYCWFEMT